MIEPPTSADMQIESPIRKSHRSLRTAKPLIPTPHPHASREKLILRCWYSLGDITLLTAAVRELHTAYPGRFLTDLRTPFDDLWLHNPYITPVREDEGRVVECDYALLEQSNTGPWHCIHSFSKNLADQLRVQIHPRLFKGDIHLHSIEKAWASQVAEIAGANVPYWIISAGGKRDITIKWWATERWQSVVDHFKGRILFAQIGAKGDHHPALRGVIDLRGKTTVRQLVRLVYHSVGVLCPVTGVMHLAAAVPVREGRPQNRACVVIAGGREPSHWEAYPHHQFLHTVGALPCCDNGGCWKSRTVPLGDGDYRDNSLCVSPVITRRSRAEAPLPQCMDMISPADAIIAIERYLVNKSFPRLNARTWSRVAPILSSNR